MVKDRPGNARVYQQVRDPMRLDVDAGAYQHDCNGEKGEMNV